jgi:ERCC4-type nuclease
MVLADHGEQRSGIPERLRALGVDVATQRLRGPDYVLSDRLAVVRLTEAALIAALRGGRLFDRIEALKREYLVVVLMVQRGPDPPPPRGQRAAVAWLLRHGVSLLVIDDRDDAAAWLARLAAQEDGSEPPPAPVGTKADDPDRLIEQLVSWLPGVSQVGARRLLGHFGSLRALFSADARQIAEVPGFGPRRSGAIEEIATHEYGAADEGDATPAPPGRDGGARRRRGARLRGSDREPVRR